MMFGLKEQTIELIKKVLSRFPEVKEAIVYGSRAKNNHKAGSDIDLTLKGEGLNLHSVNAIANELDDLLLPYTFDISIYHQIENKGLIAHIDRVGKVIYLC